MKIEFDSKEELETKYKEWKKKFEKPVWTIEKFAFGDIMLCKNGKFVRKLLSHWCENSENNLNTLAWNMAEEMGDLMSTKDRLNPEKIGYSFHHDCDDNRFWHGAVYHTTNEKIFKSQKIMEEAVELVENSQVIKDYIKEMRGE